VNKIAKKDMFYLFNKSEIIYKNRSLYRFIVSLRLGIWRIISAFIPDKLFVETQYRKAFRKKLNLRNPLTFSEKMQWLKLNWSDEILTTCSDKYKVRNYVKNQVGEHILTKLYGVYKKTEDILIRDLPDSFVLKVNHGSGLNIICKNKNEIDWKHELGLLKIYMKHSHYYLGRELMYKNITPMIICEEYLEDGGRVPIDYKFCCFNGEPRFVEVHFDRFGEHKNNLYDMEWNLLPFQWEFPNFTGLFNKPASFDTMYSIAKKLAENTIFVRTDLYNINNKIYFGEMTFCPANGLAKFMPEYYDQIIGSYLKLPI